MNKSGIAPGVNQNQSCFFFQLPRMNHKAKITALTIQVIVSVHQTPLIPQLSEKHRKYARGIRAIDPGIETIMGGIEPPPI